jgi:ferric-dicitrate binding protein FerR (iron transport regulator)
MERGVVLQDEDELLRFLTSDAVDSLVAQVRAERAAFEVSASSSQLSLSVLEGKA